MLLHIQGPALTQLLPETSAGCHQEDSPLHAGVCLNVLREGSLDPGQRASEASGLECAFGYAWCLTTSRCAAVVPSQLRPSLNLLQILTNANRLDEHSSRQGSDAEWLVS